jgi:hypothetical protein
MASLVLISDVQEFLWLLTVSHNNHAHIAETAVPEVETLGELNLCQCTGCNVIGVKQKVVNTSAIRSPTT